jgi:peptidoglycan/LPS O-acetylase OafA/YrhL
MSIGAIHAVTHQSLQRKTIVTYRREIDGLRSVAVLPVMLFHAGMPWMPGGFVGVDIFFVISGYLITSMIQFDMAEGRFSLWAFYERRMRRILPALFVVIAATFVFSWLWMVPSRLVDFGKSVLAVCAFVSNLYFWKATDYFAPSAEMQPLLHTWSLAVEEQFYIVFPVLFFLLFKFARRWLIPLLLVLAVGSFALAQWGRFSLPETRFFLPHTRAWELLLGAVLALAMAHLPAFKRSLCEPMAALGIMLISLSLFSINREMQYPSAVTLLPTLGTALIIACASPEIFVGKLLSTPLLVGIGLISYSAYLWHQPLFALARLHQQGQPSMPVMIGLCLASLVLAYGTWKFIEQPFRNRQKIQRPLFFGLTVASLFAVGGTAAAVVLNAGFEQRFLARLDQKNRADYELILKAIASEQRTSLYDDGACKFSKPDIDKAFEERFTRCAQKYGAATLVIGDSHAMDFFNAVAQSSSSKFVVGVLKESCNPGPKRDARCPYRAITAFTEANAASVKQILLTLSGDHFSGDSAGTILRNDNVASVITFMRGLPRLVPVVWLGPQVEPGIELRDINPLFPKQHISNANDLDKMVKIDDLLAAATAKERGIRYISKIGLVHFDAATELVIDGRYTYSDSHHWSAYGEALFGPRIISGLKDQGFGGL